MDVRLGDEQQMLDDMAAALAADLAPGSVEGLRPHERDAGDPARWRAVCDAGLSALAAPEHLGGSGARTVDVALVVERLASALVPVPYLGAAAWAPALLTAAGAGDAIAAVAAGSLRLAPVLRPDLRTFALLGEAGVAFDAQNAHAGLLCDATGHLHAVQLGEVTRSIDLTRTMRRVEPGAPVLDMVLGDRLDSEAVLRTEAVALALLAADLVGVMQAAVEHAVAHVRERVQFGVPVGSFQAVQHLAAHAKVLLEGSRSSMWHAAWAADELPPADALLAARQAKAFCSEAARTVGETSIQLFGGIGLTWEELAHVRQRRLLTTRAVLGDESAQYGAIATARLAGIEEA